MPDTNEKPHRSNGLTPNSYISLALVIALVAGTVAITTTIIGTKVDVSTLRKDFNAALYGVPGGEDGLIKQVKDIKSTAIEMDKKVGKIQTGVDGLNTWKDARQEHLKDQEQRK